MQLKSCTHCGQKCKGSFCCLGCQTAYALINTLKLEKYYEYCLTIYNKKPMKVYEVQNELNYRDYVADTETGHKIHLIVEGIHCGSCVWLIENTLKKQNGVLSARLNLSTRRLVLEWEGEQKNINTFVQVIEKLGYKLIPFTPDASVIENKKREHDLLKRIVVAAFGTVSLMMITFGIWIANYNHDITPYFRDILHWIALLVTIPAVFYSGRPFFASAYKALRMGQSNMDVPISLATLLAVFISVQELLRGGEYIYMDAAISLVFFLLIGRYLDLRMRNRARQYAQNLVLAQAQSVTLEVGGALRLTGIKNAREGDIAFVAAGEKIPVDGVVIEGKSEVDNSLITGETLPAKITKGSYVNAGTTNLVQPIKLRIVKLGDNTALGEIIRLMEVAEQSKARYVRLADVIAGYYTPFVLLVSLATFAGWLVMGAPLANAVLYAVSVMVITCPCALGLAVPVVQVVATGRLLSQGIIVKTADAFERLAQADYVVFDKTGTITEGKPKFINAHDFSKKQLAVIASLAASTKHPLAQAVMRKWQGVTLKLAAQEKKGFGMEGVFKGVKYRLGSSGFCKVKGKAKDDYMEMWFAQDREKPLRLKFSDSIREDAGQLVTWLNSNGYKAEIVSGDHMKAVASVAKQIGLSKYYAAFKPKDKYDHIKSLEKDGLKVLMVGDGLNDSAALALAHASMSPATALEITQTSADIIFQGNKMWPITEAITVARKAVLLVKQNFAISLIYNLVTIPFAILGHATPIMAAIIMSASSVMVVLNALRLRR